MRSFACKIYDLANLMCVPPSGVMFGARIGTQVPDLAHAVQLHIQKGCDSFGEAGLAQGDITSYYDFINCLKIARWITDREPGNSTLCFVRLQILPRIELTAGDACVFEVPARCLGTLTGSRSAVAAERIPVETVACDMSPFWQRSGVRVAEHCSITFATWVDNYYAFGSDLTASICIAELRRRAVSTIGFVHQTYKPLCDESEP